MTRRRNGQYLYKHYQTYVFKKRLSKRLLNLNLPEFEGKDTYVKSLKTDSYSKAVSLRDLELARLDRLERGELVSQRDAHMKNLEVLFGRPSTGMQYKERILDELYEQLKELAFQYQVDYLDSFGNPQMEFLESINNDPEIQAIRHYMAKLKGQALPHTDTLRDALSKTLEVKSLSNLTDKEISRYVLSVNNFLEFLQIDDISLSEVKRRDVFEFVDFLKSKALTEKTILGKTSKLSIIFKTAKNYEMVATDNPFIELGLSSKVTKERGIFKLDEVKKVYKVLPDDSKLIWKTLFLTGLRPSEVFGLNASSLVWQDGKRGKVLCFSIKPEGDGKTKSATRIIPLHRSLIDDYCGFNGFSIVQSTFEKRRRSAVISCFGEDFANRCDTYSLRHTFVTTLIDELNNKDLVNWLVGHSSTNVTFKNYFHGYRLDSLHDAVERLPSL